EVIAGGYALGDLPQVWAIEHLAQLGLPDEDDLQQLLARGLEIREEANLLEHLAAEILRLVDDEDGSSPARGRGQQVLVQRVDEDFQAGRSRRIRDAQLVADRGQEFQRGQLGIEDERDVDVRGELLEEIPADRGLARADLAGQLDEAAL